MKHRTLLREAGSLSPQLMYPKKSLTKGDGSFTVLGGRRIAAGSPRPSMAPRPVPPRPVMPPKCASMDLANASMDTENRPMPPRRAMPQKCESMDMENRLQFAPPDLPRSFSNFVNATSLVAGTRKLIQHQEEASRAAAAAKAYARRRAWEIANTREVKPGAELNGLEEECEFSEPRADIEGLLEYLDMLRKGGARLTEVTYIVNGWTLGGIIPLRHHGFCVKAEDFGYLTLDFSRRGILWDTFDTYPDLPDGTIFAKKYHINVDPGILFGYCKATKPFSWPGNDCSHFAAGMMRVLRIVEDPFEEHGAASGQCSCGPDRTSGFFSCSGGTSERMNFLSCSGGTSERSPVGCFS